MAVQVLDQATIDDNPDLWHAERAKGITASRIAAVMGLAPGKYASPFAVWLAMTEGPDHQPQADPDEDDERQRGLVLEPYVANTFARTHHWHLRRAGLYASDARPWQLATLDRLGSNGDGQLRPVQLKTSATLDGFGPDGTDVVPLWYRMQCLWEADVMDAPYAAMPTRFMAPWHQRTYWISREDKRGQADLHLMREAAEQFMERVADGRAPAVDWTPATTKALIRQHPEADPGSVVRVPLWLARKRVRLAATVKRAEQQLALTDNLLRQRMGAARQAVAVDGDGELRKVVTRVQFTRQPYKVEKEAQVDYLRPGDWRGTP